LITQKDLAIDDVMFIAMPCTNPHFSNNVHSFAAGSV